MGYLGRDDLREIEENMLKRKYNRRADRNILFIFFLFVAFLLYTAIVGIFNSKQN
jgi:hypothetical protein